MIKVSFTLVQSQFTLFINHFLVSLEKLNKKEAPERSFFDNKVLSVNIVIFS